MLLKKYSVLGCTGITFVLSRYLNGVMKNATAPVLLELANEVIIFTFFFDFPNVEPKGHIYSDITDKRN